MSISFVCLICYTTMILALSLPCLAVNPLQVKNKVDTSILSISASPIFPLISTSNVLPYHGPTDDRHSKIIGGYDASQGEIPWQVGLHEESLDLLFCGGTLLSSRVVVTAAHCFDDEHDFFVGMGGLENSNFPIKCFYDDIIKHEMYSSGGDNPQFDIALIILDRDVQYSSNVQPTALPWPGGIEDVSIMAFISGWGNIDNNGDAAKTLQVAEVQIWDQENCTSAYQEIGNQVTDDMICAGYFDYSRDSCTGDSGGPLVVRKDNYDILVGITSWGPEFECAKNGFPGVYTRVTSYVEWIRDRACSAGHCIPDIMTSSTTSQTTTFFVTTSTTDNSTTENSTIDPFLTTSTTVTSSTTDNSTTENSTTDLFLTTSTTDHPHTNKGTTIIIVVSVIVGSLIIIALVQ